MVLHHMEETWCCVFFVVFFTTFEQLSDSTSRLIDTLCQHILCVCVFVTQCSVLSHMKLAVVASHRHSMCPKGDCH